MPRLAAPLGALLSPLLAASALAQSPTPKPSTPANPPPATQPTTPAPSPNAPIPIKTPPTAATPATPAATPATPAPAATTPAAPTTSSSPSASSPSATSASLPASASCEIAVTTSDDAGSVIIDGEVRGEGSYEGRFPVGHHTLRVERVGFEPFENDVTCAAGDVYSESVLLKPSVALAPAVSELPSKEAGVDGLYGGVQVLGAFQPAGSGTTLEDACATTGATSCRPGTVAGAGLHGYVGWMIDPLGLELALLGGGDLVEPSASFNGETGSDINPLVAAPARTEKFTIARFGGGAALRARVFKDVSRFRFAFALGPGLAYRYLVMKRDTETVDGLKGDVADSGTGYVSALLSMEASAQVFLGKTTLLSLGLISWIEHAGDDTRSEPENRAVLLGGDVPIPQATPAYDMANGTQWFLGPFVGLAFGP